MELYKSKKGLTPLQFKLFAFISIIVLMFSMLMILLDSTEKTKTVNSAVYFTLISYIIGLWSPQPKSKKTNNISKQIESGSETKSPGDSSYDSSI